MRSVLGQALMVGVGVGAAVLIIRAMLGNAPLLVQLLAVLGAGMILAAFQLALSRRLTRPKRLVASRETASKPVPPLPPGPAAPPENDTGWTGLAATSPLAPPDPLPNSAAQHPAEPLPATKDAGSQT